MFQKFMDALRYYPMDMETSFVRDFAGDIKSYFCNDFNHVLLQGIGCNISVEEITPKLFKFFQKLLWSNEVYKGFKIVHL